MKYLSRRIEKTISRYIKLFPAIAITGPRQSGKSTTLKETFQLKYKYITFDDPMQIEFFNNDPKGFMKNIAGKAILDEVQKVPGIFEYLKMEIDANRNNYGRFILTGSSQFSFVKGITESLAGRIGMLSLLPFQYSEIPPKDRKEQLVKGCYPELIARSYSGYKEWYSAYISNYIERDVRSLYNIGNLRDFQRLLFLLAAHSAQEVNLSVLANEIGASVKTIKTWLSVLEASYIIFFLQPYHKNLGKRIVKRPKVYFYDTGLICYLTGINSETILNQGPLAGPVFENYIIAEIKKIILHSGSDRQLYYFRNNLGLEADLIIEDQEKQLLRFIEIKNTETARIKMAESINKLIALEKENKSLINKIEGFVLYRNNDKINSGDTMFINYEEFLGIFDDV